MGSGGDDFKTLELNELFNALNEGVIVWDKNENIVFSNDVARSITGLDLTPGTPLVRPGAGRTKILTAQHHDAVPETAPVYRAFAGEDVPGEEMRYIGPDGRHRWLFVSARRILDERGNLRYVISALRDLSLRKSREDKLRFMVESAKTLSLNLDFDSRMAEKAKLAVPSLADWCSLSVYENGAVRRVVTVNTNPDRIEQLHRHDWKYGHEALGRLIEKKEAIFMPTVTDEDFRSMARSDEEYEDLRQIGFRSLMVIPIISRGEGVGAMTLAFSDSGREFTDADFKFFQEFCYHLSVNFDNARLFREIEERDKSKDLFLASLSHELRNPLAPIKSSLELLKMRDTQPEVREELDIIEHQFDHMARLLNDLLDVSRFTQDRISLSTKPIDLKALIERALRGSDAVIRETNLTLHFTYPPSQLSVVADETRLEQAISNLLSNAVKFTPAGGSIWVDLEHDGAEAVIRVRDNGSGIHEKDLPNVFDLYYQGVNKGFTSGLGIGLLLVHRIISMHRGTVEAKSEGLGKGSEFLIRLPLAEVPIASAPATRSPSLARNMRILIVDDNSPAADALVRLLNKLGAEATAAYSGHEALGIERLDAIDLFLLDVGMPEMDGYALVRALRARGITAPIVALTGYGLAEDKERAREAGFSSHLTKPIGLTELNTLFESVAATA